MTDADVLAMLRSGEIWIVGNEVFSRGKVLVQRYCHRRYRHVRLHKSGARKSIAVHKLIWMQSRGRLVPDGCEVHHDKGKGHEYPDDLILKTYDNHHAIHDGPREPGDEDFNPDEF